MSLDVQAYAGFPCDKAVVFRDKIKWTNFIKKICSISVVYVDELITCCSAK